MRRFAVRRLAAAVLCVLAVGFVRDARLIGQDPFRFRTGVELVNVTATISHTSGGVAPRLTRADFRVYDDDQPVEITHFSAERVPVSLGIVLDTSGSMGGEKLVAARAALERFLFDLLGPDDEFFLYRFDAAPHLVTGWTRDRTLVSAELKAMRADGATALYDTVAAALPLLDSGQHRKKALLVISDGNDGSSRITRAALTQLIRQSDALVYAIGIDSPSVVELPAGRGPGGGQAQFQRRRPMPFPIPMPGRRSPPRNPPTPGAPPPSPRTPKMPDTREPSNRGAGSEREGVDAAALHDMTDGSGGRTEIVRSIEELGPTAAGIADELSTQYYLGYPGRNQHDGRWHTIRVEVSDPALRVRSRSGYVAQRGG